MKTYRQYGVAVYIFFLLSHYFTFNVYMVVLLFNTVINVFYCYVLLYVYVPVVYLCSYCMFIYMFIVCLCIPSATLTEVFPCFFLSCKANARVTPAKMGYGPHSS
jgi:hypothetical protein